MSKKRALTLFLVFLVMLMPVSISVDTPVDVLYVSILDGKINFSKNSCLFGGLLTTNIGLLIEQLNDKDVMIRRNAAEAIGYIASELKSSSDGSFGNSFEIVSAIKPLIGLLDYTDTRTYAAQAIEKILLFIYVPDERFVGLLTDEEVDKILTLFDEFSTKKNAPFFSHNFYEIYKTISSDAKVPNYERYSFAIAVWRYMRETGNSINDSIEYITNKREQFRDLEILNSNKNLIVFTGDEAPFSTSDEDMISFAKKSGVLDEKIIKDNEEGGNTYLKGKNDKQDILNKIQYSNGETVIWFEGHGFTRNLWLTTPLESYSGPSILSNSESISYVELANSLKLRKENLDNMIIILNTCFSYNFAEKLYDELGDIKKPTIITAANLYSSTPANLFFFSLKEAYSGAGGSGPLMGNHFLNVDKYVTETNGVILQDSAIFFGGEIPVEIASNNLGESECDACEGNGPCPFSIT